MTMRQYQVLQQQLCQLTVSWPFVGCSSMQTCQCSPLLRTLQELSHILKPQATGCALHKGHLWQSAGCCCYTGTAACNCCLTGRPGGSAEPGQGPQHHVSWPTI